MACAWRAECARHKKAQYMRNDLRAHDRWSVARAPKSPHEVIQISVLTRAMINAVFLKVNIMLRGIFRQAVLGLCERAHHTESACCRTTAGGKLNEVLATR
jgi:hypothetical protein